MGGGPESGGLQTYRITFVVGSFRLNSFLLTEDSILDSLREVE
jgi:hypothetical protein